MFAKTQISQPEEEALQPLREVGVDTKTQFWDMEEIQEALRIANLRGIPMSRLFSHPSHVRHVTPLRRAS